MRTSKPILQSAPCLALFTVSSMLLWALVSCPFAQLLAQGQSKARDVEGIFNQLLAPGPLMIGHKDFEHGSCSNCHELGGGIPDSKCLDCHTEIAAHVKIKRHYHGLVNKTCIKCHSDHKGRAYDALKFDTRRFNHATTGWRLTGAHAVTDCAQCHTRKRTGKPIRQNLPRYFGTSNSCKSCHQSDDVHFFTGDYAQKECSACHSTSKGWKPAKFNHTRDTGFALQGRHARLSCESCHVPNGPASAKYAWPNLKVAGCLSCHEDHHKANLSAKFTTPLAKKGRCTTCHNQEKWPIANFDHRVTGYGLSGSHARISCGACHQAGQSNPANRSKKRADWDFAGLKQSCASCHADYHGYKNLVNKELGPLSGCQTCHNDVRWKPYLRFDHTRHTDYPLTGKHTENSCFQCHRPLDRQYRAPGNDGSKDRAPEAAPRQYRWKGLEQRSCQSCHANPHPRSFQRRFAGWSCDRCHVTDGWKIIKDGSEFGNGNRAFHQKTRFPLDGKHTRVSCDACHLVDGKQVYKFPYANKDFCINCHDNVHKKQFRRSQQRKPCSTCHNTEDFAEILDFDHNRTRFRLTGAHALISEDCSSCHKPSRKITLPTDPPKRGNTYVFKGKSRGFCDNCHTNDHKKMFRKKFSRRPCASCHTLTTFRKLKRFDHNETNYELRFKHKKVKCSECHTKTKKRYTDYPKRKKGLYRFPQLKRRNCQTCHEDVHKGANGSNCASCHSERGWKAVGNFHQNLQLHGVHMSLTCENCHSSPRPLYGAACLDCHAQEDTHNRALPECGECHLQTHWGQTKFEHGLTRFPLVGSHRTIECSECHNSGIYDGLPLDCASCHFQDAIGVINPDHSQPGFEDCQFCHNPFSFK